MRLFYCNDRVPYMPTHLYLEEINDFTHLYLQNILGKRASWRLRKFVWHNHHNYAHARGLKRKKKLSVVKNITSVPPFPSPPLPASTRD